MEIRLFGRSLFEAKKSGIDYMLGQSRGSLAKSKYLPDFNRSQQNDFSSYISIDSPAISDLHATSPSSTKKGNSDVKKPKMTPKDVYNMRLLHDETFKLNTNPEYVDGQIADFTDKLEIITSEEYDMSRGVEEISSVLVRLENRKKYSSVKDFFEEYPYTTTGKINELVKNHDYLKLGQVAQFIADMPKEATEIMKGYNKKTQEICGKNAVFYIIADKKDFEKSDKRRDPILLAQSPFGHFWQILGAWDKEMLFIDEL